MQFNNGNNAENRDELKNEFSPREFLGIYLKYLPWLLFSALVCVGLAYAKLRYSTNLYLVESKIIIKTQSNGLTTDRFESMFMNEGEDNLRDEIEQIKSTSITKRVVEKFDLQKTYFNVGKIRSTLLHRDDVPFKLKVVDIVDSSKDIKFKIKLFEDGFSLEEEPRKYNYDQVFKWGSSFFTIQRTGSLDAGFASNIFETIWTPKTEKCQELIGALDVSVINEYSNVLSIKYETENVKIGKEIVNGVMSAYQDANLEDKKQIAVNALLFIDDQLDTLKAELGGVERNLQVYREKNKVIDVEQQSSLYFGNVEAIQTQITDLEVKKRVVGGLIEYLETEKNRFRMVPNSLGIPEPSLVQLINQYNRGQLEREVLLSGTTTENPVLLQLELQITKVRQDILQSLKNIQQSYQIALGDLSAKSEVSSGEISKIPGKQKQLIEITRQQKILEDLYSLLLQKKLETSISSASTINNSRIVEPADASSIPVKPNRKAYYLIALLIGLAVPVLIILLRELFNDKVLGKSDIERFTRVPVLGEIGHSEVSATLVVSSTNRSYIAEQFRILRTNLQFFIQKNDKAVILVTSSFSGEGKSFISTNLGAVLALSGKKTLILELDIRKPKIMKGLGLNEAKGITNYIVGDEDIASLVKSVPETENLFVIPCGPIPPNPAELLMEERVGKLFAYAKANFDIVIVDTAPVGMISDAMTLGQYANTCVYIVRHDYTLKRQIRFIEELYTANKLPKLSIVINDVAADRRYGQGYYSYGYGYGYGHGYSTDDYFEETKKSKKRKWFKKKL